MGSLGCAAFRIRPNRLTRHNNLSPGCAEQVELGAGNNAGLPFYFRVSDEIICPHWLVDVSGRHSLGG